MSDLNAKTKESKNKEQKNQNKNSQPEQEQSTKNKETRSKIKKLLSHYAQQQLLGLLIPRRCFQCAQDRFLRFGLPPQEVIRTGQIVVGLRYVRWLQRQRHLKLIQSAGVVSCLQTKLTCLRMCRIVEWPNIETQT